MMGSKYLQSRIEESYKDAESFLNSGREVLFVGTPCQIAGLRSYLRNKNYSNLLAVDFICHGVPSPGVWRRYLAEAYGGYDANEQSRLQAAVGKNTVWYQSLNAKSPIGDIKFRDKTMSGWKKFRFVVRSKSASKADKNSVLSSDIHSDNPFMQGFLSNIYLRPSCYDCKCKNGVNHSDLTIADFWGIQNVASDFDDDKGVGLVLVNTQKGKEYFDLLGMDVRKSSLEIVHQFNGVFCKSVNKHPKRSLFFTLISDKKTIKEAVYICSIIPLYSKILNKFKRLVKKSVKYILGDMGIKIIKNVLNKKI